ncbi:MAG: hypothetical protein NZ949_07680, partial [Candidatus Kapabacteria bacterium]|nr:hypothetical protein [Candidatus Kapabacteria bacterium]
MHLCNVFYPSGVYTVRCTVGLRECLGPRMSRSLEDVVAGKVTEEPILKPSEIPKPLPILPLRDVVIYPFMLFPVVVGRPASLRAVAKALERKRILFVTAQ